MKNKQRHRKIFEVNLKKLESLPRSYVRRRIGI